MILFIIYICGIVSFLLWDACIGLGAKLDGYENPPLWLVAMFWFIAVPILLFYNFIKLCYYLKITRIERQKKKEKFRIQEEKRIAIEDKKRAKEIEDAYLELEANASLAEEINNLRIKSK